MTDEELRTVREAGRFLRTVFDGNTAACATVLVAEADIMSGTDVEMNLLRLQIKCREVSNYTTEMIDRLKKISEKNENK